jgi:hypothetical protein
MNIIDDGLKQFATERQISYIDAINQCGSNRKAAKALGIAHSTINRAVISIKRNAALRGYSPEHDMTRPVPSPYIVKGISTYYNAEGKASGQWIKSTLDNDLKNEAIREGFEAMAMDLPRLEPIKKPLITHDQLCNLFTITDFHLGMLANEKESGADWDLKIAEELLVSVFEQSILAAPHAKIGVINQLGDFLHSDGIMPITPTSGHIVDQDGRFAKIVTVALRLLRRVIDIALIRHEKVIVLMAEGNHDITSSIWLRVMFKALYEKEPRVTVIDSDLPYYQYQHGKTMLAFHHGHLSKNDSLPLLFASQFPKVWGDTTKRYCHTGHRHHVDEKEHSGMKVIQHATLAARDAYASRGGWISEREATVITYHKEYGQVARHTITPEMLRTNND